MNNRMFRVLGFFALAIGLMALAGDLMSMALLFLFQAALFGFLGYLNLSERSYVYLFWAYMVLSFLGITYWSFFHVKPLLA